MTPPCKKLPKTAVNELVARAERDEDTLGASIVASAPHLQNLATEARRLQTIIDSLDPETEAEKIGSYQNDIATLRGFIVACVSQRNLRPNDAAANVLLGKLLQEDQEKIQQRFEEKLQKISQHFQAARKTRRKKKPTTTTTDEDGDDDGEVMVRVEGIMGPPRLSTKARALDSKLPKAPTRILSKPVESQEREKSAAVKQIVSLDEDHASTWVGPLPFWCGGSGSAQEPEEHQLVRPAIVPNTKQVAAQEGIDNSLCANSTTGQSPRMGCFQCLELDDVEASSARSSQRQGQTESRPSPLGTKNTVLSVNQDSEAGILEGEPKTTTPVNSGGCIPIFGCGGALGIEEYGEALPAQDKSATVKVERRRDHINNSDDASFGPSPHVIPSVNSKANNHVRSTNHAKIESTPSDSSDVAFDLGPGVAVTVVEFSVDEGIVDTAASYDGLSLATESSDALDKIDSCLCLTDDDDDDSGDDDDNDMICAEPDTISAIEVIAQSRRKANFFSDVWQQWKQQSKEKVKKAEGSINDKGLQDDQTTRHAEVRATKAAADVAMNDFS